MPINSGISILSAFINLTLKNCQCKVGRVTAKPTKILKMVGFAVALSTLRLLSTTAQEIERIDE